MPEKTPNTVVAISGSRGLIGSALYENLIREGYEVRRLVRSVGNLAADEIPWSVSGGALDPARMSGADYVIHLAGEPLLGLWTAGKMRRIRDSRVIGVENMSRSLAALDNPPKALLVASAVGFYGNRDDEELDEKSPVGVGFLADTCRQWEAAADSAREAGIRVVHLRFGIVLSKRGGALKQMLTPFRLGLGGRLGSGRQYMSWVALADVAGAVLHLLKSESAAGPVNITAPSAITNLEFTRTLARTLRRPAIFPAPGIILRALLREQATEMLLASQRVFPRTLIDSGYEFRFPELGGALGALLSKPPTAD